MQYAALLMMIAQVTGFKAGELVHGLADAHIYDRHIPVVKEMLENPEYPAPKLWINPEVKDFYDFTVDDFKLEGYEATPLKTKLEVAV